MSSSPTSQVSPDVTTKEKKARVLIVDDDPEITESFGLALEDTGLFQVEKYTDPLIVLSNLKPNQYDVVLLDIKMPNIDSFKLYEKMKKIDSKLKVCFIGIYKDKKALHTLKEQFPSLEIDCFMQKPVKIQSLIKRINSQLGR